MLLDVQHISKSFTTGYIRKVKKEVLKDISFTLSKGETLGIAGTSGAGKTTLIRILMQLLRPDGGVVLYHGLDLGELSGKEMLAARRTMQMIFQNPAAALHPRMTIRESIEEPSRLSGKMDHFEERMQEMLSRLQLRRELLSRYPAAYAVDRTRGTNPVIQQLGNMKDAGSLYGGIIYNKAPLVMRQLEQLVAKFTIWPSQTAPMHTA